MYLRGCTQALLAAGLLLTTPVGSVNVDKDGTWVVGIIDGDKWQVRDDRQPSLYTADYGDCLGKSAINVTRFDAAYYKDNMTIIFHLEGETGLRREDIMMNIGVYAYGESRFDLTFNPCDANILSACPVKAGVPIEAAGIIPINQDDVAGIPEIALSIPDFEGQAILRLFSNSTQNEAPLLCFANAIGCFAAQITNGFTFQQKSSVGTTLGLFTLIAVVSSFATAAYGSNIVDMRKHYAHSLSVSVVFAVWHHIFYSGALSVNWPSVLVAFWSNYAWAGGMIYSESMQNTINDFIGSNKGNTSHVGAAGTGESNPHLGGGVDIHQIYKRDAIPQDLKFQAALAKRHLVDVNSGFKYYGLPVKPGLPLPGNYSGFAGTLATEHIPASNAFMTGLLWFLILIACGVVSVLSLKAVLEGLGSIRVVKKDRLAFFRSHYLAFALSTILRTIFIGFYMLTFLAMFQFSYLALSGPVAVACAAFFVVVFGIGSIAAYACFSRLRIGKYASEPDRLNIAKRRLHKIIPWFSISRNSKIPRSEDEVYIGSVPWWTIHATADTTSIHDDEQYTTRFGWLASRYRKTRWWFFVIWLFYEFVRACFLAGASTQPFVQVFGLLAVEIVAFIAFIILRPFEGQRLNVLAVYLLGLSKITTTGLSAAFDTRFGVARIPTTVIGIIIIVIQGLLTVAVMILILIGAVSSYLSMLRNREQMAPLSWNPMREKYFAHIDFAVQDIPRPRAVSINSMPELPKTPYFEVRHVKRIAKVEDEDDEFMREMDSDHATSELLLPEQSHDTPTDRPTQRHRSATLQSQASYSSLPKAARLYRPNWSRHGYSDSMSPGRHRALSEAHMKTPKQSHETIDTSFFFGALGRRQCRHPG
ncbi:uncharacterized protein J4E78_006421 [Alternaria triticimaculans]|uniref:uncharacterized protein n=1 Tax=Alternaria triticimaculans TaxID=297637 RepID=UPI0020C40921|nr:uncharacterized protein J4E78_006421 [Alternaria triticimaculans]KAI4658031.1 hypothetical protein J4E78_006421 [Alternaria triticimaculans]